MIKLSKFGTTKGLLLLSLAALSTGCMSLENEEGRLPDAVRSTISGLIAKGYPDLTKIPDAPTDLPAPATWTALESRLVIQGRELAANPAAAAPTSDDTSLSWAQSARSNLEADPRAQPVTAPPAGVPTELESAAAARAKFDADLARLPPL